MHFTAWALVNDMFKNIKLKKKKIPSRPFCQGSVTGLLLQEPNKGKPQQLHTGQQEWKAQAAQLLDALLIPYSKALCWPRAASYWAKKTCILTEALSRDLEKKQE